MCAGVVASATIVLCFLKLHINYDVFKLSSVDIVSNIVVLELLYSGQSCDKYDFIIATQWRNAPNSGLVLPLIYTVYHRKVVQFIFWFKHC